MHAGYVSSQLGAVAASDVSIDACIISSRQTETIDTRQEYRQQAIELCIAASIQAVSCQALCHGKFSRHIRPQCMHVEFFWRSFPALSYRPVLDWPVVKWSPSLHVGILI